MDFNTITAFPLIFKKYFFLAFRIQLKRKTASDLKEVTVLYHRNKKYPLIFYQIIHSIHL